jgi:hypothetical protein
METNFFPGQEKLRGYWNRPGGKFGVIAGIGRGGEPSRRDDPCRPRTALRGRMLFAHFGQ